MAQWRQKITDGVTVYRSQWSQPGKGNLVPYKEIVNLGLGGMGQQFSIFLTGMLTMGIGNTLVANTLGIRPMHIQYIAIAQTIIGMLFSVIRGKLVDNTRTKYGRFRPYIAVMGFPLVLMTALFIFLPLESMDYSRKLTLVFLFSTTLAVASPLFTETYNELQTVITPNSEERAKIYSVNSLIYSFAPTITGFLWPFLANYTGGFNNIATYRYISVPVGLIGVGMNLFTAVGCKERMVVPKNYTPKIKVWQGVSEIYRNKYWWLRTVSGWIGFLESANTVLLTWLFMYSIQDTRPMAFLNTVLGTASTIAMVSTASLLKRFDNRGVLILHNALNIIFVTLMLFCFEQPYILAIFVYLNSVVNALPLVYNGTMHSEVKDYQQYISGKRMDFTFGIAGLIGTPVTLLSGMVLPAVYERCGLTTNYDVLYDPLIRHNLMYVLCLLSILGAVLNLIPFFFYDLSREKHRNYIRVLRYRALFDDYAADALMPETVVYTVDAVREAFSVAQSPMPDIPACKLAVKQAAGRSEKKQTKTALREAKRLAEQKEHVSIFMEEYHKFDNPAMQKRLEQARMLDELGLERLHTIDRSILEEALALPNKSDAEKKERSAAIQRAQAIVKMALAARKKQENGGMVVPDEQEWHDAVAMQENTKEEQQAKKEAVKLADKRLSDYNNTFAPYLDAKKLLRQWEMSRHLFADAEAMYDDAQAKLLLSEQEYQKKQQQEKDEKQAELERVKQRRVQKK